MARSLTHPQTRRYGTPSGRSTVRAIGATALVLLALPLLLAGSGASAGSPATAPVVTDAPAQPGTSGGRQAARRSQRTSFQSAAIIPIRGEISDVTAESLKRRLAIAQEAGAELLVFDLDTPGGSVLSTFKICDTIKSLAEYTVAWIHPKAYSAGSIIAISCDEIVVSQRSTIGDAMPISLGPEGPAPVSTEMAPKITSPLLEEVRDSAIRNDYDLLLCEALIVPDRIVYWVVNPDTGERRFVAPDERDRLFGYTTTRPGDVGSLPPPGSAVASLTDWTYVESVPLIPNVRQPIVSSNELLTMSQNEAIAYGFATEMISTQEELAGFYGIAGTPLVVDYTWSENLVAWLTSPAVRAVLLALVVIGGYIELNTPGLGLAGLVALLALAVFLGAPYLTGLASFWDVLIFLLGAALLLVEIFVLPGFGIAGFAGITLMIVGLVASFVPGELPDQTPFHWPTFQYTWEALENGLIAVAIAMVASLVGMVLLSRYFQRLPVLNKLVLANPTPQEISIDDWFADLPHPGEMGVTLGPLRPAGKARFGARLADVVAESDFIDDSQPVQVVERVGNRVVVRRVNGQPGPPTV